MLVPEPSESRYWTKKERRTSTSRLRGFSFEICRAYLVDVDEKSRRVGSGILDGEKLKAVGGDHRRGVSPVVSGEKNRLSGSSGSSNGGNSSLERGDERSEVGEIVCQR